MLLLLIINKQEAREALTDSLFVFLSSGSVWKRQKITYGLAKKMFNISLK